MTWTQVLAPIKNTAYFTTLWQNVSAEYARTKVFPPKEQIFRALQLTKFEDVKVVILGQDPYHNDFQADGLSFSVVGNIAAPPSLRNIFAELRSDLGISRTNTDLTDWAIQGVLLLNATLTVQAHKANSHQGLGWERFTDFIIQEISERKTNVVFVLWGAFAQKKAPLINGAKHHILKAPHPSPLSAHRGFFGSRPFSKINGYLSSKNATPISW